VPLLQRQCGDSIWKDARWTRMFQTANDLTTVKCGATVKKNEKEIRKNRGSPFSQLVSRDTLLLCTPYLRFFRGTYYC
jgi:hypothetical protein